MKQMPQCLSGVQLILLADKTVIDMCHAKIAKSCLISAVVLKIIRIARIAIRFWHCFVDLIVVGKMLINAGCALAHVSVGFAGDFEC